MQQTCFGGDGVLKKIMPWVKEFVSRADMLLFSLCMICSIFGIVMISSATATSESGSARYVLIQFVALLIGIGLFVLLTVLDIDVIVDKWPILVAISAALLLALIPFGHDDGTGNKSWIRFLGIGIQPSEIVKVIYIALLAKHISYLKEYKNLNHVLSVAQLAVHFFLPFAMVIVISGDLGSALIFFFIFAVMLFAAGLKLYWFVLGVAALAAVIPFAWTHVLRQDQINRILAPYDPSIDPLGDSVLYQAKQSKLALASGQLTGTGLFQGTQTQSQAVPAQQTDFIFSVIGEELGFIGSCITILLLAAIVFECLKVARNASHFSGRLIATGVAAMIAFHSFVNIGVATNLLPNTGLPLPFISYGLSSLLSNMVGIGLVINIDLQKGRR